MELDDCVWENFLDIDDIKSQITLSKNRLSEFFRICIDLKGYYGVEFEKLDIEESNEKLVARLHKRLIRVSIGLWNCKIRNSILNRNSVKLRRNLRD